MFAQKAIIITIGEHGTVVSAYSGSKTLSKLFIDILDEKSQNHLKETLSKIKSAPIYIMLDTADQIYRKKNYPLVKKGDLRQIIKRDFAADKDRESVKNYLIFEDKTHAKLKERKSWETLFINAPLSENINSWIKFLLEFQNELVGIYMLPIESVAMFEKLKSGIISRSKINARRSQIYCLIVRNRASQIRQMVFSNQGMIFTRTVDYNFENSADLERYEHDIYSTFEYLKRLHSDLKISEFEVVNILAKSDLDKITKINNIELNFINYTPNEVAQEIGFVDLLPNDSAYLDLVISKCFYENKKKVLRFSLPKIEFFHKFFLGLKFTYYLNLTLLATISILSILIVIGQEKKSALIEASEIKRISFAQDLAKLNRINIDNLENSIEQISAERIVDFGKNEEAFNPAQQSFIGIYERLKFVRENNMRITKISYQVFNKDAKNTEGLKNFTLKFSGEIKNSSGDIEDLFQDFDSLNSQVENNFKNKLIKHNELPRNIDFSKKYYAMPVDFTISNKSGK